MDRSPDSPPPDLAVPDALDVLDAGIAVLDGTARVRLWNRWLEAASGIDAAAVLGRVLFEAIPVLDATRLKTAIQDVLETGAPGVLSHTLNPVMLPLRVSDGQRMVHNVVIRPLACDGGRGCILQVTDVTASVHRERVLREQRDARYRAIVDAAPDAIVTLDTRGVIQWANGAAALQFQHRPDALIGRGIGVLLDPLSPQWDETIGRFSEPGGMEIVGRRRDGTRVDLEPSVGRWESQGRSFFTVILRDMTERRRSREALEANALAMKQMAEQTRATLDALPAHIAVLDQEGRIVLVNKAWADATADAPFLGARCRLGDNYLGHCAAAPDQEGAPAVLAGLSGILHRGGPAMSMEYHGPSGTGRRWFRCLAAPMEASPYGGAVVMHIDNTDMKEMEAALREVVGQKSTLLREVNHRVKNSLQLVSSLLTLQTMTLTDETARAHFRDARSRIEAIALVHNRLYQTEHFQSIEFGSHLAELCDDLERASGGGSTGTITVHAEPVELPIDQAAPLGLIANELITNAIKHRGAASARVSVDLVRDGATLVLTVADHGPGLPDGFQIGRSRSLGMRLVTSLASQIGATVTVLPVAEGAAFRISLPLPAPEEELPQPAPQETAG